LNNMKNICSLLVLILGFTLLGFSQNIENIDKKNPVKLTGSLDIRGIRYTTSGIESTYPKTSYVLSGNPVLSVYGIQVPFSFMLSNQGVTYRQPFNQFGFSPTYKKMTVHAGYRNVSFSPFTLGGHTMLGAGFEANPGKVRIGFMYGRLNKATVLDPTTLSLQPVTFGRRGFGGKLGYGSENNYVDITFLKANDDPSSVSKNSLDTLYSNGKASVFAAENLATSITFRFGLAKNLFLEGDAAGSLYTRDQNSPIELSDSSNVVLKTMNNILKVNGTSGLYTALQAGLRYKAKKWNLKLQYRRIDPDYKTMGAYFFQNDLQNITIAPTFSAMKGKLRFSGSVGVQQDNLKKLKTATSTKLIGSANMSVELSKTLGIDINYANFSNNQTPNTTRFADSLKITQTTQNLSVTPRFLLVGTSLSHMVMLSANVMQLNDFNTLYASDALSRNMDSQNFFMNYSLSFLQKNMSVFANLNHTTLSSATLTDTNNGLTVGLTKSLLQNKLSLSASGGFMLGNRGTDNSNIINSNAQLSYQLYKNHRLSLNSNYLSSSPKGEPTATSQRKYSELRAEIAYGFQF
jgi:hypothetical protein